VTLRKDRNGVRMCCGIVTSNRPVVPDLDDGEDKR
jgi:hypothetical protein